MSTNRIFHDLGIEASQWRELYGSRPLEGSPEQTLAVARLAQTYEDVSDFIATGRVTNDYKHKYGADDHAAAIAFALDDNYGAGDSTFIMSCSALCDAVDWDIERFRDCIRALLMRDNTMKAAA